MSIVSKYIETNYIWCCWLIWKFCLWLTSQIINCSSEKTPFFMMFMFWCFFASQIVWKLNFLRNIGLVCTPYIKMDTIDLSRFNRLSIYTHQCQFDTFKCFQWKQSKLQQMIVSLLLPKWGPSFIMLSYSISEHVLFERFVRLFEMHIYEIHILEFLY